MNKYYAFYVVKQKNNVCIQRILKQTAKYNCTVDF